MIKKLTIAYIAGILTAAIICAGVTLKRQVPAQIATTVDLGKPETLKCRDVIAYKDKTIPGNVLAKTRIAPSAHVTTETAVLKDNGVTELYTSQEPLPWIAFNRRREAGISYGFSDLGTAARFDGSLELVQIRSLHAGLTGTVDSSGRWFGGARVWANW